MRAPRRMQELYLQLAKVVATLGQELGRSPTIAELAAETEASEEEVLEALEAGQAYRFASLDAPAAGDGEADDPRLAARQRRPGLADAEQPGHAVARSSAQLPPPGALIVHLRFFEGLTQSEIAGRPRDQPDARVPACSPAAWPSSATPPRPGLKPLRHADGPHATCCCS